MVDVGEKLETERVAVASGRVRMTGGNGRVDPCWARLERRCARGGTGRGDNGRKENSRYHPNVPSAHAHANRRLIFAER